MKKFKRMCHLLYGFIFKNKQKWQTLKIIFLASFFEGIIHKMPQKKLYAYYGEEKKESSTKETTENMIQAYWIGRRVEEICDKLPWKIKCFARALTAQKLLKEKQIHTTMYLGIRREKKGHSAHAWLRCGTVYVTGGNGEKDGHVIVTRFYK